MPILLHCSLISANKTLVSSTNINHSIGLIKVFIGFTVAISLLENLAETIFFSENKNSSSKEKGSIKTFYIGQEITCILRVLFFFSK